MSSFTNEHKELILEETLNDFIKLSTNPNGLCVIKKVIPECNKLNIMIDRIINIVEHNVIELSMDPYGNYVVQEIIMNFPQEQTKLMIKNIINQVSYLSTLKFSSNVIEKCLEKSDNETRQKIIRELIDMNKIVMLMKNTFGNYVVKKALLLSEGNEKKKLIASLNN